MISLCPVVEFSTDSARLQDCIAKEFRARMELDEYHRGEICLLS